MRSDMVTRQWRLLVILRRGPRTLTALAKDLEVTTRTVRRDLEALQSVPLPIAQVVRRDKHRSAQWGMDLLPEWPRNEYAPVRELGR
jgi:predicted DNA-binding transcriptional regulator YafY